MTWEIAFVVLVMLGLLSLLKAVDSDDDIPPGAP